MGGVVDQRVEQLHAQLGVAIDEADRGGGGLGALALGARAEGAVQAGDDGFLGGDARDDGEREL